MAPRARSLFCLKVKIYRVHEPLLVIEKEGDAIVIKKAGFRDVCEAIYALVQLVPVGYVTSYKNLGRLVGVHPRVVSRCLRVNNSIVAIPCHRVVYHSRKLSGYTTFGKDFKRKLLEVEGVKFENDKIVSRHFIDINSLLDADTL